jgi:hypothetical protein
MMGYLTGESKPPPTHILEIVVDGNKIKEDRKVHMVLNPKFEDWDAASQWVLSYLLGSLSKDILVHIASCTMAAMAWKAIQGVFASHTQARTVNTQLALGTTCKGKLTVIMYFSKMKALGGEMAVVGKTLEDKELIEYIIAGLNKEYTPLVTAIYMCKSRVTPTFYKNKFFCANRSAYKNAYQIVVHMKNFPKINLV